MHKSAVSSGEGGGDTKGKESIIDVSANNPRPTFSMMGVVVFSTVVSIVEITLTGVVGAY